MYLILCFKIPDSGILKHKDLIYKITNLANCWNLKYFKYITNKVLFIAHLSPNGSGRSFYSDLEDLALMEFVKEHKDIYSLKGNNLYKEAEKTQV